MKKGDQIAVKFETFGEILFHHGIYGEDFEVIDFNDNGVRKMDLMKWTSGQPLFRIIYPDLKERDPDDVVKTAETHYQKQDWEEYHVFENNCEHFATWCKTNNKISPQSIIELRKSLYEKLQQILQMSAASSSAGSIILVKQKAINKKSLIKKI